MLIGIIIGIVIAMCFLRIRNSTYYRKVLTDLFVTGRIRQIAKDKDIDLAKEFEDYKSFMKKRKMSSQSLDDAIETEISDAIDKMNEEVKKTEKKSKS